MRTEGTRGKGPVVTTRKTMFFIPGIFSQTQNSKIMCVLLLLKQESGEFAEGLHARTLPLGFPALPARRAAEGPDADGTLRPFRSVRPALPPPALLLLRSLLPRPHGLPRPAPHHGAVSHADVPAQPQHGRARLPPPDAGAHLPQPQPNAAAAVAVAKSSAPPWREVQREEVTLFGCMPSELFQHPQHDRKWTQLLLYSYSMVLLRGINYRTTSSSCSTRELEGFAVERDVCVE